MPRRASSRGRTAQADAADMVLQLRGGTADAADFRVVDLRRITTLLEVDVPARARKADLVRLVEAALAEDGPDDDESSHGVGGAALGGGEEREGPQLGLTPSPDDYIGLSGDEGATSSDDGDWQHNPIENSKKSVKKKKSDYTTAGSEKVPEGCLVISRDLFQRTLEVTRQNSQFYCVDVNNPEQKVMRFLYERARGNLDSPEAYKGESLEEKAQKAAARIMGVAVPYNEEYSGDSSLYNEPVDPNICRLEAMQSTTGQKEVRVLKLRFPKYWSSWAFNLPPPFFSRAEKLQFDADSSRVVDEVRRSIQSLLRRVAPPGGRWTTKPGVDLLGDQIELFYLLNGDGDVVLLNKDFLKRCPLMDWESGREEDGPSFYVCKFRHPWKDDRHNSLPHFQSFKKSAFQSYIWRLLLLAILAYLLVDPSPATDSFEMGPYLPSVHLPRVLDFGVDTLNTTTRVLHKTGHSLWVEQTTYRACALRSCFGAASRTLDWMFGSGEVLSSGGASGDETVGSDLTSFLMPARGSQFSMFFLLVILLFAEYNILWIRSRFCLLSLGWLVLRRYIFVIYPSTSVLGASPVPHGETTLPPQPAPLQLSQFGRLTRWLKLVAASPFNVCEHLRTVWQYVLADDWLGFRRAAEKLKVDACDRNEGVAQIVYEDAQVFRWFTYRWCPNHFNDPEDKDRWIQTLRAVCGMPDWKKVSTQPDLIISGVDRPGINRVVSHQFLQNDPMLRGVTSPIEEHPVLHVHPPATRSRPASFASHFRLVIPWYSIMCAGTWALFTILPFVPWLNSAECSNLKVTVHDGLPLGVFNWRFYWRIVLGFFWMNTASALVGELQNDATSVFGRWLNKDPLLGMYGSRNWKEHPTDITAEEKTRRTLSSKMWFVFGVDTIFFCMATNDLSLLTGALALLVVAYLAYSYGFSHLHSYEVRMKLKKKNEARVKHLLNPTLAHAATLKQKQTDYENELKTCRRTRLLKLRESIWYAGILPGGLAVLLVLGELRPYFPEIFAAAASSSAGVLLGIVVGLAFASVADASSRWLLRVFTCMTVLIWAMNRLHEHVEDEPELGFFFASLGCFVGGLLVDFFIWNWILTRVSMARDAIHDARGSMMMLAGGAVATWFVKRQVWEHAFGTEPGASMALGAMAIFVIAWMPFVYLVQFLKRDFP